MARKKINDITSTIDENIKQETLDYVMGDRYAVYAKYVIQDRAIPDARDGLKPVQRRIIYSMYRNGNTMDKPTKKCATIVGAVMGKLHPHGDSSIYGALVRMSQSWVMNMPLIKFQGNNGSIDNDPPAAYRYTEAKLNDFSMNLVRDLDKNTVDMTLNFDDTELEPIVLPARYPNLFVNGSEGIAVAIATEIPPHNLKEIIDATIYRINHPHCSVDDLLKFVHGPDFPTGGIVYKCQGLKDIYLSGRGKIEIASKVDINENKDTNQLIITNIPYKVNKQELVYSIDKIRKSKEVDGILEVLDESANDDIKIVIELKKDVDPQIVLTYLFNKTQLKVNYSANIVAISNNRPKTLTLNSYLDTYIAHQIDVITRRSKFDLNAAKNRLHIVLGLIKAINVIDDIVKIIKQSKDKKNAKENLMKTYDFTEPQAESIVMMHLYKLSNTDVNIYINERDNLNKTINELEEILADDHKLKKVIIKDLKEISNKYGIDRRTEIKEKEAEIVIEKRDLIAKEDVYVTLTREGYIKRSSLKSYKSNNGSLPGIKSGDSLIMEMMANTMDYILAFTNKGNYLFIPVHEIIDTRWKDEGKHINYLITLPMEEIIIKSILVKDFTKDVSIGLVSKNGQIKKTKLSEFFATRYSKPIACIKLLPNDELVDVSVLNGNSNLFIITKLGNSTYFNENEITHTGLKTSGVKAISTLKNSEIESLLSYRSSEKGKVLFITDECSYRVFDISNLELTDRLGRTQMVFNSFKSSPHNLVFSTKILNKNEPMVLNCLLSDNSVVDITINDFKISQEKMCKKNLNIGDGLKINNVFIKEVQVIDSNTIIEKPKNNSSNNNSNIDQPDRDSNEEYEQISIFDEMGD